MLKILQARLQQYVNHELHMFRLVLEKAEEPRSNCQHPLDHGKSKSSRNTSISALLTMPKPLPMWITINCGKFSKRWAHQTTWLASWEICMQVRKQQLELDMDGEGNGNPLQCSCLENPRDGGAWWAAVYGVAQSRTRKRLSSSSSSSSSSKCLECQDETLVI